jgi:hypothetical protein
MAKKRKKRTADPPVALVLTKRDWSAFVSRVADLETLTVALRDVQRQLSSLLDLKQRQALAALKAVETRRANEAAAGPPAADKPGHVAGDNGQVEGGGARPQGGE